jgi:lysophospholipase L1-like esterase
MRILFIVFLYLTNSHCIGKKPRQDIESIVRDTISDNFRKSQSANNSKKEFKVLKMKSIGNIRADIDELVAKLKRGDSIHIICLGNSITYGYKIGSYGQVENPYPKVLNNLLCQKFNNNSLKITNEGHNGWRADQALAELETMIIAKKPDWVFIKYGINDAYFGFSEREFAQNLRQIVLKLTQNGIRVLLLSPTPIDTIYNEKIINFSSYIKKIAEEEKVAFFHLHEAIAKRAKSEQVQIQDLLPDEVHFADDKYTWIAEEIFDFLMNSDK